MGKILTNGASTGQACRNCFENSLYPQGYGGRDLGAPPFSFNNVDEISAYIFGFWLADGGISFLKRKHSIYKRFSIFNTDIQIISEFEKIFNKNACNSNGCYTLQINSDELFDFCYNAIGNTKKSGAINEFYYLTSETLRHTVRGFFDGDGSIYHKIYKNRHNKTTTNLALSFTASKDCKPFLKDLNVLLNEAVGVQIRKITGKANSKLIFGQYDTMLLCEWMYRDSTLYMARKKKIWDEFDKIKLQKSFKYRPK